MLKTPTTAEVIEVVALCAWLLSPVLLAVVDYVKTAREINNH